MRKIDTQKIYDSLTALITNCLISMDEVTLTMLGKESKNDTSPLSQWATDIIVQNARLAQDKSLPLCQDTGMAVVFLEIGQEAQLTGEYLEDTVNRAVADAYRSFRKSVTDPISRKNTGDNTPAVIHTRITKGDKIRLKFLAKGFGSENQSRVFMLTPTSGTAGIIDAVVNAVRDSGSLPCPPIVVGVGVGGTLEKCALLSKEALLRQTGLSHPDSAIAAIEKEIKDRANALGIGVQGFGGTNTCLAVHIETFPTHIAGLPVAVNIQCHAVRHGEVEI